MASLVSSQLGQWKTIESQHLRDKGKTLQVVKQGGGQKSHPYLLGLGSFKTQIHTFLKKTLYEDRKPWMLYMLLKSENEVSE